MVFPLASLPLEIVNYHLLMYMDVEDILSLSHLLDLDITPEVYNAKFHDGTRFDKYDIQMFRERAAARLYVINNQELIDASSGQEDRMCQPTLIDYGGPIVRVRSGAQHVYHQISNNRLYGTLVDVTQKKRDEKFRSWVICSRPTNPYEVREPSPSDAEYRRQWRLTHDHLSTWDHKSLPTMTDFDSSPYGLTALDYKGRTFTWSLLMDIILYWQANTPLYVEHRPERTEDKLRTIWPRAGKVRSHTLWVPGVGILVPYESSDYGGYEETMSSAELVMIIPHTEAGIADWVALGNHVVYMDTAGRVTAVTVPGTAIQPTRAEIGDPEFDPLPEINELGPFRSIDGFAHVSSDLSRIVLVTRRGRAVIVALSLKEDVPEHFVYEEVPELYGVDIASVSISGTCCMAFSKKGDVYAWGTKRDISSQTLLRNYGRDDDSSLVPAKVDFPGKVYGIFTGDWTSAVLLYQSESLT